MLQGTTIRFPERFRFTTVWFLVFIYKKFSGGEKLKEIKICPKKPKKSQKKPSVATSQI
jgi:hypothetical protein